MEPLESFYKIQREPSLQIVFKPCLPSSHKHHLLHAEFSAFTTHCSLAGMFVFNSASLCKKKALEHYAKSQEEHL